MTTEGRDGKVSAGLPFSGSASKATSSRVGTATFGNKNDSPAMPIVRRGGGAQIDTVVNDIKAPKRYAYKV